MTIMHFVHTYPIHIEFIVFIWYVQILDCIYANRRPEIRDLGCIFGGAYICAQILPIYTPHLNLLPCVCARLRLEMELLL